MLLHWTLLCSIVTLTVGDDCPPGFTKGPKEAKWGQIPRNTKSGWIIRGKDNFWTMTPFTNAAGSGDIFKYKCTDSYGRIQTGGKICCHSTKTTQTGFDLTTNIAQTWSDKIGWVITEAPMMLSYGSNAYGYTSTVVEAADTMDTIKCKMGFGDKDTFAIRNNVQKGDDDHTCTRGEMPLSLGSIIDGDWSNCGQDGKGCTGVDYSATPRWFRFGGEDRYIYTLILNLNQQKSTMNCMRNVAGGYNPNNANSKNKNFCWISEPIYQFATPIGKWVKIFSCTGCESNEYKSKETFTVSEGQTTSSELWASMTVTMTEKISMKVEDTTEELKEEVGSRITTSITDTMTWQEDGETDHVCNKISFWQWITSADTYTIDGVPYTSKISTKSYLCANIPEGGQPQCPAGYCADADCQTCTCNVFASDTEPDNCPRAESDNININYFEGSKNNNNWYVVQWEAPIGYLYLLIGLCLVTVILSAINYCEWTSKSKSQAVTYKI